MSLEPSWRESLTEKPTQRQRGRSEVKQSWHSVQTHCCCEVMIISKEKKQKHRKLSGDPADTVNGRQEWGPAFKRVYTHEDDTM